MKIIDLEAKYFDKYFVCLEDWSEEIKESGNPKETWYEQMKDKGLRVKIAVERIWFSAALAEGTSLTRLSHQSSGGNGKSKLKNMSGRLELSV